MIRRGNIHNYVKDCTRKLYFAYYHGIIKNNYVIRYYKETLSDTIIPEVKELRKVSIVKALLF
jgi:hypothetical protein